MRRLISCAAAGFLIFAATARAADDSSECKFRHVNPLNVVSAIDACTRLIKRNPNDAEAYASQTERRQIRGAAQTKVALIRPIRVE